MDLCTFLFFYSVFSVEFYDTGGVKAQKDLLLQTFEKGT